MSTNSTINSFVYSSDVNEQSLFQYWIHMHLLNNLWKNFIYRLLYKNIYWNNIPFL